MANNSSPDMVTLAAAKTYTNSVALGSGAVQGPAGQNGRQVEITADADYIKWRYIGDAAWINIVALSALRGLDGDDGTDGDNGDDGETPQFRMDGNTLQYKFPTVAPNTWTDLYTFPNPTDSGGGTGNPADLISSDPDNLIRLGSDEKLLVTQEETINFPVPDYTNPVTILDGNGTATAPNDGWIQRVCQVTNTPYVWAEMTIDGAATPIHNTSYQGLALSVEYLLTSPLIAVQKGTNIDAQMGIDPAGTVEINVIKFYRVNYVGMTEIPDGGWERGTLSDDVQASLGKADTALQSFTETDPVYTADKPNIALKSEIPSLTGMATETYVDNAVSGVQSDVDDIKAIIPPNATTANKLATMAGRVSAMSFDAVTRTLTLTKGDGTTVTQVFPQSSDTNDGFMTAADVATVKALVEKVESLAEGGVWRGTFATFADLQTAYPGLNISATNWTVNDFVYIQADETKGGAQTGYITTIVSSVKTLVFSRIITTPIATATNSSLGVVKGESSEAGKIYIETDGTMSLLGYDAINTAIGQRVEKVQGAALDNIASLNSDGSVIDSGKKASDFATAAQGTLADNAQPKISATGNTNLLLAPTAAGGQPTLKPISDFLVAQTPDIPNGADLNTAPYLSNGIWRCSFNTTDLIISNTPPQATGARWGMLTVTVDNPNQYSVYVTQIWQETSAGVNNRRFIRAFNVGQVGSSVWQEVLTNSNGMPQGTAIPNAADLNAYTTAGFYNTTSDANAQTVLNLPPNITTINGFSLMVTNASPTARIQTLTMAQAAGDRTFKRHLNSLGTWYPWSELALKADTQDFDSTGTVKLSRPDGWADNTIYDFGNGLKGAKINKTFSHPAGSYADLLFPNGALNNLYKIMSATFSFDFTGGIQLYSIPGIAYINYSSNNIYLQLDFTYGAGITVMGVVTFLGN